jgi:hypothetical protein
MSKTLFPTFEGEISGEGQGGRALQRLRGEQHREDLQVVPTLEK